MQSEGEPASVPAAEPGLLGQVCPSRVCSPGSGGSKGREGREVGRALGKQNGSSLTHQVPFGHGLSLPPPMPWALCEDRLQEPHQGDYSETY